MKTTTLIYIHGFKFPEFANTKSKKGIELADHFDEYSVFTPDVPLNPQQAVKKLSDAVKLCMTPDNDVFLVGSSLGGFYALYLSAKFNLPTFLINPSLTPWVTLKDEFSADELEYLHAMSTTFDYVHKDNVNAFLANDDERINHEAFKEKFDGAYTMICYDNVGHVFTEFKNLVIPEISQVIDQRKLF